MKFRFHAAELKRGTKQPAKKSRVINDKGLWVVIDEDGNCTFPSSPGEEVVTKWLEENEALIKQKPGE